MWCRNEHRYGLTITHLKMNLSALWNRAMHQCWDPFMHVYWDTKIWSIFHFPFWFNFKILARYELNSIKNNCIKIRENMGQSSLCDWRWSFHLKSYPFSYIWFLHQWSSVVILQVCSLFSRHVQCHLLTYPRFRFLKSLSPATCKPLQGVT